MKKKLKFSQRKRYGKPHQPELYVCSVTISEQSLRREAKFNISTQVYLLLQSSYVTWFLQLWILEACRTSGKAIEHLETAQYIEGLVYCVPIPPGADNAGRTNLRILKTSSTSCVLLCLWSFKGFESRKPHCTRGLHGNGISPICIERVCVALILWLKAE